jgi:hypothetical protein
MDTVTLIRVAAGVLALTMWFFGIWILTRVFRKAGCSGTLGLLGLLLGFGWFIAMLILAFGDWPALRKGTFAANAGV